MTGDPTDRFAAATQVTVEDLDAPELDDDAAHHLRRVLRLRGGTTVTAADGHGGWRNCRLGDGGSLTPLGPAVREPAPEPMITVGFVPVKGDRPELVVQKLTELGVDRIAPFHSERSVVRWHEERGARQLERLARIARAACEQSRRLWLPTIGFGLTGSDPNGGEGVVPDLAAMVGRLSATGTVAAADRQGEALVDRDDVPPTVLIGPEGGWAPVELDGLPTVGLGDTVLRAETAAIAAGTLLTARRSARMRR